MATTFNAATAAYTNAARLMGEAGRTAEPRAVPGQGPDFAAALADAMQGIVEQGRIADAKAIDLVNGQGSVVDVVTAISQTEMAMETMVAVRDRVISAYEEIMRMPI
jgi:flagellar hook-basal body complex protein FliE